MINTISSIATNVYVSGAPASDASLPPSILRSNSSLDGMASRVSRVSTGSDRSKSVQFLSEPFPCDVMSPLVEKVTSPPIQQRSKVVTGAQILANYRLAKQHEPKEPNSPLVQAMQKPRGMPPKTGSTHNSLDELEAVQKPRGMPPKTRSTHNSLDELEFS